MVYQALIFGASGIGGWAIANQALTYPTPTTFSRIIALTNRPLSKKEALVPEDEIRLELRNGIDLSGGLEDVTAALKAIEGIENTTHVYFCAYTAHSADFPELRRANTMILKNAIGAVEKNCPNLIFFTLQTGGKAYGVEFPGKHDLKAPFKESMPRIPAPLGDKIFYYPQYDLLHHASHNKDWRFAEIRPDAIVGFVPNNNAMNIAQIIGLFLSLYASVEGPGASAVFPGTPSAYTSLRRDTSQDNLARFTIFASLRPEESHTRAFNIADEPIITWSQVWPELCAYFGLKGVGPDPSGQTLTGARWMLSHKHEWSAWVQKNNLKEGVLEATVWEFIDLLMTLFDFDKQLDLTEARGLGFKEEYDTMAGYRLAFSRMKQAHIIPEEENLM